MLARLPDAPVLLDEPDDPAAPLTVRDLTALLRKLATGEAAAAELQLALVKVSPVDKLATVRLINEAFARIFEEGEKP